MNIFDFLFKKVDKEVIVELGKLNAELSYRRLAFHTAANLMAKSLSKCEFRTFKNGEEIKSNEYYLWNIEPNKNENSIQFLNKANYKLFSENECLIISPDGETLLVADSFQRNPYVLFEDTFTNVQVGEVPFARTFQSNEVLFLSLNDKNLKPIIDAAYEKFGELISCAIKHYKKTRGIRGKLKISGQAQEDDDFQKNLEAMQNVSFKKFFNDENSVLTLFDGFEWEESGSKTYSYSNSNDIRALVDDVYNLTARAFNIPPALLKGDLANMESAVDNFLTFALRPYADLWQTEINRKRYGRATFLRGSYLKIDTRAVKHIDLLDMATPIDKLIASGGWNIDDMRRIAGDEPLNTEWSKKHWITKNYEEIKGINADG